MQFKRFPTFEYKGHKYLAFANYDKGFVTYRHIIINPHSKTTPWLFDDRKIPEFLDFVQVVNALTKNGENTNDNKREQDKNSCRRS